MAATSTILEASVITKQQRYIIVSKYFFFLCSTFSHFAFVPSCFSSGVCTVQFYDPNLASIVILAFLRLTIASCYNNFPVLNCRLARICHAFQTILRSFGFLFRTDSIETVSKSFIMTNSKWKLSLYTCWCNQKRSNAKLRFVQSNAVES